MNSRLQERVIWEAKNKNLNFKWSFKIPDATLELTILKNLEAKIFKF